MRVGIALHLNIYISNHQTYNIVENSPTCFSLSVCFQGLKKRDNKYMKTERNILIVLSNWLIDSFIIPAIFTVFLKIVSTLVAWWTCWKWSTLTVISHMDISIYVRHGRISYQQIPTKRNIILLKKMRHPKTYVPPHRGYLKMFIVIIATGAFYEDVLSTLMHINVYKRVYTRSAEWCICLGDPKGAGHYKCMWDFHSLHMKIHVFTNRVFI